MILGSSETDAFLAEKLRDQMTLTEKKKRNSEKHLSGRVGCSIYADSSGLWRSVDGMKYFVYMKMVS